jgi:hypothetical protein
MLAGTGGKFSGILAPIEAARNGGPAWSKISQRDAASQ